MNTPVVLITGALTGIARATAFAFAKKGAKIVASGRHDDAGATLIAELRAAGAEAEFVHADVRHEDDVRALVDETVKRFGRLDIAVNAAGTERKPGPAVEQTAESYAATFDTNVLGTVVSMKHELRAMQAQGSGSIVNISSTFGHEGGAGASIYAASKHAVEGLTKSVALEAGTLGIRVNAVAPGPIQTGMLDRFTGGEEAKAYLATLNAQKRIGQPDEIARAILYRSRGRSSTSPRTTPASSPVTSSLSTAESQPADSMGPGRSPALQITHNILAQSYRLSKVVAMSSDHL
jgi:NAD(P)-dependent dehydrogenase (short-subunit alcohol dehydrogenase family)